MNAKKTKTKEGTNEDSCKTRMTWPEAEMGRCKFFLIDTISIFLTKNIADTYNIVNIFVCPTHCIAVLDRI